MSKPLFRFKITPDGGEPYEVDAFSRDVAIWERTTAKGRTMSDFESLAMNDLYGIAYAAAFRQAIYTGKHGEFVAAVDLELVKRDEPDPTQPEASTEP
jgi:hypothetical protein